MTRERTDNPAYAAWASSRPGSRFIGSGTQHRRVNVYIDTASPEQIRTADRLYGIGGVTTNPSIVAGTDRLYRDAVETAAEITGEPVFARELAVDADRMVREAHGY